jgi:hypothetical protein
MPRNVQRFAWLWGASLLMSFVAIPLLPLDSSLVSQGMTRPMLMVIAAVVIVIFTVILLPFFWLAVWRRKNWARWVLLVLFVISLPLLFLDPEAFVPDHLPSTIIGFGTTFIQIVAFFFLFTGDAKPWFRREMPNGSANVLPNKS